jgi:toxin ParE1/3/4
MAVYKLSPQAEAKLVDIYEYSLRNFGERQADKYYMSMHEAFQRLAEAPLIGRLFHEFRRHEHDQYAIFYELIDEGVKITMIYHHSENIAAKFR